MEDHCQLCYERGFLATMAASREKLSNLFDQLCNELADQIKEGKKVIDKDGNLRRVSPDASVLNVTRQLLKDNGIEADHTADEGALHRLKSQALPFPSKEEVHKIQ